LRAAIEGILARARILNDLDELSTLTTLPTRVLCRLRCQPSGDVNRGRCQVARASRGQRLLLKTAA
jgi:hypothetical protein